MANTESNQPEKPVSKGATSSATPKSKASPESKRPGGGTIEKKEQPKRRVSRREKDERNTRILYAVLGVAGVLIALVLGGQALNHYYFIPNKVLASVNGEDITREDYWKYRSNSLVNQISQYQQYANFFQGQQQQQYLAMAQQASVQLDGVWGSTSTDPTTLEQMIDDKLYLDGLNSLGLTMTDQDVENFIADRFSNQDAPLFTPTPTPTLIPERAAWATDTAIAAAASQTAAAEATIATSSPETVASPETAGTPDVPVAVESASPVTGESTPAALSAEQSGSPSAGTPVAGSPAASPAGLSTPVPASPTTTPSQDEIRQTATANFDTYSSQVFDLTHMNRDDYIRLIARPALARELVNGHFQQQVGQSAEQVEARHILVGTKELADKLAEELKADPSKFEQLAKENSVDTSTAPNGGDLGWFTRGVMVEPFEKVAFALKPGEISEPVQTQFGWHIIQAIDHQNNRALTDEQITQAVQAETNRWLGDQRAAAKISAVVKPTPTPSTQQFVPPAGAPTIAPATPFPASPVSASPVSAETGSPTGTPVSN